MADGGGGARVRRTGIALVHEGELILAAPGSEAELEPAEAGAGPVEVRYVFPVEVEVRGAGAPVDADSIAELALRRLTQGLRAL